MAALSILFTRLSISAELQTISIVCGGVRTMPIYRHVEKPKPGVKGKSYRRLIHYPEKYTVEPLDVTNLAGRDPLTGRVICQGIGGGIKHKYHWISWLRHGPKEGTPDVEKVIKIIVDGCRTAHIALIGTGNELKYILATENMKAGDMLKVSSHIPRIPVRPNEGDAYPLGALPLGTLINCVEKFPGFGGFLIRAAGTYGTIIRKAPDNRVVVQLPSKHEYSLPETCMCTVGRLSNAVHSSIHIGSANRLRELGYRPRSGLWHRKTGKSGRKIRALPPVKNVVSYTPESENTMRLSLIRYPECHRQYTHRVFPHKLYPIKIGS